MEKQILELLKKMDARLNNMDEKLDRIETQQIENTQILKALEHKAEVNQSEHDKMMLDIAESTGEIQGVRQDLTSVELITSKNWNDIAKLKSKVQ
ncbi:MAG: hypothetical protein N4A64_08620 [Marinisporobacter sp.]|jgi:chromosome segregation ATPase|nr:hypothetical protein [Marinisporobacter sp.]